MSDNLDRYRPSAIAVAQRYLILLHIVSYVRQIPPPLPLISQIEKWNASEHSIYLENAERSCALFWSDLHASQLWQQMTPREQQFALFSPINIPAQVWIDAGWNAEAVCVLAWVLSLTDSIPAYDTEAGMTDFYLGSACERDRLICSASLRSTAEVDRQRNIAELWHWRSRTRFLMEQGLAAKSLKALDAHDINGLDEIVRIAATEASRNGDIPPSIDGDFPALNKAYRELTEDEWSHLTSIAVERHRALNWVCGLAPNNDWDETPTNT